MIQLSTIRSLLNAHLPECRIPRSVNAAFLCGAPILDAAQHCLLTLPRKSRITTGGKGNKDAKAKRNLRKRLLRRHGSRRGGLPGSGVTSSTPHRSGPSAQTRPEPFLPTSPLPELVAASDKICLNSDTVSPNCSISLRARPG